jgi:dihydrofolate synthase/folylpolyglutamate synthase
MEVTDFESARRYLESLIPKGKENYEKIGLSRINALLAEMGNPQDAYPTIHIGGTAGKGSTSTMIASVLQSAGYKTGLHISPHLEDIRERMQVNGKLPSDKQFTELVKKVKSCVEKVEKNSTQGTPSYFEALLAVTFEWFKVAMAEIAVIEVGMGGRLDGTNVITPKTVVITNIGLDHMEVLGDSIEEIATEKAGIFKPDADVVAGVTQNSVIDIVEQRADELGCSVDLIGRDIKYDNVRLSENGSVFDLAIKNKTYKGIGLSLIGAHQVGNAALAIDAVLKSNDYGFVVDESAVRKGLANVVVPCRFEVVRKEPTVILDGAHNPMKMDSLVAALSGYANGKKLIFIFASKKDKNVEEMITKLSPLASKFYFTSFSSTTDFGKRMSYNPKDLKQFTKVDSATIENAIEAYGKALSEAKKDDIICITGSLYLAGELRQTALGNPQTPA